MSSRSQSKKLKKGHPKSHISKFLDIVKNNNFVKWVIEQRDAYPIIVYATVPALFFWTQHNMQELTPALMRRTLVYAIFVALVYYFVWYLIYKRDKFKASLMAIITIVVTYTYGQIFAVYQKIINKVLAILFQIHVNVKSKIFFTILVIVIYIGIAYLIKNRLKYSNNIRNYVAIFAGLLLVLNLYPLIKHWTSNNNLLDTPFGTEIKTVKDTGQKPDIYYIIPEDYASERPLKEVYNYDNSPFLDYLRQKNFYVASKSAANYPFTTPSLASSLNLDYIPEVFKNKPDNGTYYNYEKDKIENNRVTQFLKGQGYEFINLGAWWTATKYNENADQDLYDKTGLVLFNKKFDLKEHELTLFQDTIAWPLFDRRINLGGKTLFGLTFSNEDSSSRAIQKQSFLHQIDTLKQISHQPGPKYIFTQFMLPHPPYVFDDQCNSVKSPDKVEYKAYLSQLKCVNIKIKEVVDYILSHNETKPVIIIQTDEGSYPEEFREDEALDWNKASPTLLHQKADILNAYYFPDGNYKALYESISPVNSFRVIFDQYFGTDLGLLDDRHYFQESEKKRFFLTDLTDRFER